ncbi:hypothetical protein EBR57_02400 [bacterium]|nr:hypothetical protein [bacterium]
MTIVNGSSKAPKSKESWQYSRWTIQYQTRNCRPLLYRCRSWYKTPIAQRILQDQFYTTIRAKYFEEPHANK